MKRPKPSDHLPDDPYWYKDAIIYELRVRSFFDSNDDGVGDLRGLIEKLDYLEELGVTALWLLPFYPSPLRDDGYDISSYTEVHPDCGTLADFKSLLREAHQRGMRVITELVINHTSDQHPWFQRARSAPPGSAARDFYVWSDSPQRYSEARVIFRDVEQSNWAWDPVAHAYYWHRFYAHQPDLNFENPAVRRAMLRVLDFWLGLGVDGLRLDAVPYLFEREGTSCENLPETLAFVSELRRHVDARFKNRMLLAEANQWPEDAVAYLAADKCHMAFHFPIMPRMFMAVRMEDRFPLTDIIEETPALPESSQWALFLRNHDELTLEMVTEEERDYMYGAYAREPRMRLNLGIRRRFAPLLNNNRRTIELLNALLFSLPGTPVLYYGDEIGMGDNVYLGDRDGVRTPMQWSPDRNAGFSRANPQRLVLPINIDPDYHYESNNVEAQARNRHSLLWWMRRLIALRRHHRAFGRGAIELLQPANPKVLAFMRTDGDSRLLVVANLSRYAQHTELELGKLAGLVPRELFGNTSFPKVEEGPYGLALGPHNFYWFAIEPQRPLTAAMSLGTYVPPEVELQHSPEDLFRAEESERLLELVTAYVPYCRWFGGKARAVRTSQLVDTLSLGAGPALIALVRLEYTDGDTETYVMPLAVLSGERAQRIRQHEAQAVIARLRVSEDAAEGEAVLADALADPAVCQELLALFDRRRVLPTANGELSATPTAAFDVVRGDTSKPLTPRILRVQQSNSSLVYGERIFVKLMRRLDEGASPEAEMTSMLTQRGFASSPTLASVLEYRQPSQQPQTLAILQAYVRNEGDMWQYTLEELGRFFERARTRKEVPLPSPPAMIADALSAEPPPVLSDLIGHYYEVARILGRRTAELHLALAAAVEEPDFAPEPYTSFVQRPTYQSMRNVVASGFRALRRSVAGLPADHKGLAQRVLALEDLVKRRCNRFLRQKLTLQRIRCHGDLHLSQILRAGRDFVFIDFEGEPSRPPAERRRKRAGLRDVAALVRSFHYAALTALAEHAGDPGSGKDRVQLESWARAWHEWVVVAYLKGYLGVAQPPLVPRDADELQVLLDAFLLEKAVLEMVYELSHRPDWLWVPLTGIEYLAGRQPTPATPPATGSTLATEASVVGAEPRATTGRPPR